MFHDRSFVISCAALAVSVTTALAGEPTRYNVAVIPLSDEIFYKSTVHMNNSNQVCGQAREEFVTDSFLYSDGEVIWLDELPGIANTGLAVNDNGHVAGWAYEWGVQWPEAYLWRGEDDFDLLGRPDGAYTYGQGVNDHDQVVGFYLPEDGHPNGNAFVMSDSELIDIGPGQAMDINNLGMIVGQDNRYFGDTALWTPNGNGGWDLQLLDGQLAHAINESGTMIAGSAFRGALFDAAAVWHRVDDTWVRTDIGNWDPDTTQSIAFDVNDAGQVVGQYQLLRNLELGWLYENDEVVWLNDRLTAEFADWHVRRAIAINESGHILAHVLENGIERSAILIPDELSLLSPRPGIAGESNTFISTGATQGEIVHFLYGFSIGSTPVPGCPEIRLDLNSPRIAATITADANGEARLVTFVPSGATGRTIYLQTVERATCSVSNLVTYTFR